MSFTVEMTGIDEAKALLKKLRTSLPPGVEKATRGAGQTMQTEARDKAPVDTGNLVKSIQLRMTSATSVEVEAKANYAGYVEFGTTRMRAQPFWVPAFAVAIKQYEADLRKALKDAV